MTALAELVAGVGTPFALSLTFVDVPVRVLSSHQELADRLAAYYAPWVTLDGPEPGVVVSLVQGEVRPEGPFVDVPRGAGRKVKEAIQEVPGGRLVLKRTTGVVMGLWPGHAVAAGDVASNLNQAINLVNAGYAKRMLERGHTLLHAAGVSWGRRGVVLAGVPGAGKSTAALHLVEAGFHFVSNDRILARPVEGRVDVLGYPKQPRVNPGTLLHHPRLRTLLAPEDREALGALPAETLWWLERKHDVDLDALYGRGTVDLRARMELLVLLAWRPDGTGFAVRRLDAAAAMQRLPMFAKDLGVFDLDRAPGASRSPEARAAYRDVLERVAIVEVTGKPDFSALGDLVGECLGL